MVFWRDQCSALQKEVGSKDYRLLSTIAGKRWKTMTANEKKQWFEASEDEKHAYEKFVATSEGRKALVEKYSKSLEKQLKKQAKREEAELKKALLEKRRAVELATCALNKHLKEQRAMATAELSKPAAAYFLWFGVNREQLQKKLGTMDPATVGKKGCEMWTGMKDAKRKHWEDAAEAQKDAYKKYVNSKESMAASKPYEHEVSARKSRRPSEPAAKTEKPTTKKVWKAKEGA